MDPSLKLHLLPVANAQIAKESKREPRETRAEILIVIISVIVTVSVLLHGNFHSYVVTCRMSEIDFKLLLRSMCIKLAAVVTNHSQELISFQTLLFDIR